MSSESSYIFMLRNEDDSLEVKYNQQSEGVSAQMFITRGCYFDINNLEDMDKLIAYLSEIRDKMVKHYAAKVGIPHFVTVGDIKPIEMASVRGARCKECNGICRSQTELRNQLCFDCEKKQILQASLIQGRKDYDEYLTTMEYEEKIIQAADSFKPVVCMICEGQFDNLLQKQLGICGKCMIDQAKKDKRNVGNYTESIKENLKNSPVWTDEDVQPYVDMGIIPPIVTDKIIMCKHIECDNESAPGQTKCYLHIKQPKTHLAESKDMKPVDESTYSLTCLVNSCERVCVDSSGYCSKHKEDHEPIRRKITPTDITKPGC